MIALLIFILLFLFGIGGLSGLAIGDASRSDKYMTTFVPLQSAAIGPSSLPRPSRPRRKIRNHARVGFADNVSVRTYDKKTGKIISVDNEHIRN